MFLLTLVIIVCCSQIFVLDATPTESYGRTTKAHILAHIVRAPIFCGEGYVAFRGKCRKKLHCKLEFILSN